jgi:rod shape-determining protein MreD
VKLLRVVLAIAAAALAQMLLIGHLPVFARYCDLFLIVVVYFGLTRPPAGAMAVGAGAGLVEDALIGSILGLNGFKKTLLGYLVASFGALFMLNQTVPRFGILFLATLLDPFLELGLSLALGRAFALPGALDLVWRGLGNGVFGLLFFWVAARLP